MFNPDSVSFTNIVTQVVNLFQLHTWIGVLAFVLIIGTWIKNSNWYKWGWQAGKKLSLVSKLAPVLHGLAQASGWLAALLRGFADGMDGKEPVPPLGTEIPESAKPVEGK